MGIHVMGLARVRKLKGRGYREVKGRRGMGRLGKVELRE